MSLRSVPQAAVGGRPEAGRADGRHALHPVGPRPGGADGGVPARPGGGSGGGSADSLRRSLKGRSLPVGLTGGGSDA